MRRGGLLPDWLHRWGYRRAHALRSRWRRLMRPHLRVCRIVALGAGGEVLLVRHSFGSPKWNLPGGAMRGREDAVAAAMRELAEEVDCQLQDARQATVFREQVRGATFDVHVVVGETADLPRPDRREVTTAAFFPLDRLPPDRFTGLEDIAIWVADWRRMPSSTRGEQDGLS